MQENWGKVLKKHDEGFRGIRSFIKEMSEQVLYKVFAPSGRVGQTCENSVVYYLLRWYITTFIGGKVPDIYQQLPIHLKTGGMGKTIRIQYSVIQFFFKTLHG